MENAEKLKNEKETIWPGSRTVLKKIIIISHNIKMDYIIIFFLLYSGKYLKLLLS